MTNEFTFGLCYVWKVMGCLEMSRSNIYLDVYISSMGFANGVIKNYMFDCPVCDICLLEVKSH